jgi:hypothetical protein
MVWSKLPFGKYQGKTLPQIVLSDSDWFFWAVESNVFQKHGEQVAGEARDIDRKARNIRVPCKEGEDLVVEYVINSQTGMLRDMKIVPRSKLLHEGSSPTDRKEVIDLSFPRRYKNYDKLGSEFLLESAKYYLFGDSKYRLTKARCEAFFEDNKNFVRQEKVK